MKGDTSSYIPSVRTDNLSETSVSDKLSIQSHHVNNLNKMSKNFIGGTVSPLITFNDSTEINQDTYKSDVDLIGGRQSVAYSVSDLVLSSVQSGTGKSSSSTTTNTSTASTNSSSCSLSSSNSSDCSSSSTPNTSNPKHTGNVKKLQMRSSSTTEKEEKSSSSTESNSKSSASSKSSSSSTSSSKKSSESSTTTSASNNSNNKDKKDKKEGSPYLSVSSGGSLNTDNVINVKQFYSSDHGALYSTSSNYIKNNINRNRF